MPTAPTIKRKPWSVDRVQHKRVKDMRWFYNSRKWRAYSKDYKVRNPFCIKCEEEGIAKASRVTDHKKTFEQDAEGFNLDALHDKYMQPMCKQHHDSKSGKESHAK